MIKCKFYPFLIFILTLNFLYGCSKIRESAGVTRKSPDEFQAIENPLLIIPPDYNLVPPDQLQEKNIDLVEKELAEEILFGLKEEKIVDETQLSTMNQILLKANTENISDNIRHEINEDFTKEMSLDKFQFEWKNEIEILDAVKESERIREKNFKNESIAEGEIPIIEQKIKKKKKRFFFF